MSIASGLRTELAYIAETTQGVTPTTPTLKYMRPTSRNLNLTKNLLESAEVLSHGQEITVRHGFNSVTGQWAGEFQTASHDEWIAAGLRGVWSSALSGTATVGCTGPNQITRASGSFLTDGVQVGDSIITTAFSNSANNGIWFVIAVVALTITVAYDPAVPMVTGTGGTYTLSGKRCDLGLTKTTFTVERRFADIGKYEQFTGVTPSSLAFNIPAEALPTLTWSLLGLKKIATNSASISTGSGGVLTAAPTGEAYDPLTGDVIFNGKIVGTITSIDGTVNLNRSLQAVVGSIYSPDIFEGRAQVSGNFTGMLEDASYLDAFQNETTPTLAVRVQDIDGVNFQSIFMPKAKLTAATSDPGQTGPVMISGSYRALYSSTLGAGTTIRWFRTNTTP